MRAFVCVCVCAHVCVCACVWVYNIRCVHVSPIQAGVPHTCRLASSVYFYVNALFVCVAKQQLCVCLPAALTNSVSMFAVYNVCVCVRVC